MRQPILKNEEVHIRIKTALLRAGYTQSAFSQMFEVDKGLLSKVCNGNRFPSLQLFEKIMMNTEGLTHKDWDIYYEE